MIKPRNSHFSTFTNSLFSNSLCSTSLTCWRAPPGYEKKTKCHPDVQKSTCSTCLEAHHWLEPEKTAQVFLSPKGITWYSKSKGSIESSLPFISLSDANKDEKHFFFTSSVERSGLMEKLKCSFIERKGIFILYHDVIWTSIVNTGLQWMILLLHKEESRPERRGVRTNPLRYERVMDVFFYSLSQGWIGCKVGL